MNEWLVLIGGTFTAAVVAASLIDSALLWAYHVKRMTHG